MSDFSLKILNSNNLRLNLRNCRNKVLGWGGASTIKSSFLSGVGRYLSDRFFFNSTVDDPLSSEPLTEFLKQNKIGERRFFLSFFIRVYFHFLLARLVLEVDLVRRRRFLYNLRRHFRSYRGIRSFHCLPCRGQRTRTNASSRKIVAKRKKAKNFRKSGMISITGKKFPLSKYQINPFFEFRGDISSLVFSPVVNNDNINFQLDLYLERSFPEVLKPLVLQPVFKRTFDNLVISTGLNMDSSSVLSARQHSILFRKSKFRFKLNFPVTSTFNFITKLILKQQTVIYFELYSIFEFKKR
jgi:ribosomal protein S13